MGFTLEIWRVKPQATSTETWLQLRLMFRWKESRWGWKSQSRSTSPTLQPQTGYLCQDICDTYWVTTCSSDSCWRRKSFQRKMKRMKKTMGHFSVCCLKRMTEKNTRETKPAPVADIKWEWGCFVLILRVFLLLSLKRSLQCFYLQGGNESFKDENHAESFEAFPEHRSQHTEMLWKHRGEEGSCSQKPTDTELLEKHLDAMFYLACKCGSSNRHDNLNIAD